MLAPDVLAQDVSFGVIAGGYAHRDFNSHFQPGPGPLPTFVRSGAGGYVVGPSFELCLSDRLSFEFDALYKPLHYENAATLQNGVIGFAPATVVTWQFPVLAKYRLRFGRLRPFLEGGPSFRAAGNLNSSDPSHFGVSAGVGLETQWRRLRFSPQLRYTRWAEDAPHMDVRTRPDQLELLAGFSYVPVSQVHPFGGRVSLGLVVVSTVSSDVRPQAILQEEGSFQISRARPTAGVGPTVEIHVSQALSVEADAIPRSIRSTQRLLGADGIEVFSHTGGFGGMWEFPVLAKLRLAGGSIQPFIALGPSFRLPKFNLPIYGATVGGGFETTLKRIRIAPAVRYTRWGPDRRNTPTSADSGVSRNQVQLLVGISF